MKNLIKTDVSIASISATTINKIKNIKNLKEYNFKSFEKLYDVPFGKEFFKSIVEKQIDSFVEKINNAPNKTAAGAIIKKLNAMPLIAKVL